MPFRTRLSCPLCGSLDKRELANLPFDRPEAQSFLIAYYGERVDLTVIRGGALVLDLCRNCGGIWQREILDEKGMTSLYDEWIASELSLGARWAPSRTLQFARHAARLLRLFPNPTERCVLDYGMGWGDWCHMMQSFGFHVHGVELSPTRLAYAQNIGVPCSRPDDLPAGPYDFIYLEQTLEHLPDPQGTLAWLTERLRPGGYIHIGVPNGKQIEGIAGHDPRRLLAKGPAQPLEHINIFTPAVLRSFLASFGCVPARQQDGLVRLNPLRRFAADLLLAAARQLPPTLFPQGTSLLFRKASATD